MDTKDLLIQAIKDAVAKVIKKRFNGINFNCVNYRNIVDKVAIEEKDKSEDVTTSLN